MYQLNFPNGNVQTYNSFGELQTIISHIAAIDGVDEVKQVN